MELVCIDYCTLYGSFRLIWNWCVLITVRFMAPFVSYGDIDNKMEPADNHVFLQTIQIDKLSAYQALPVRHTCI